jgi:rod shape-determining protein MreD
MSFSLLIFFIGLLMVLLQTTILHLFPVVPDLVLIICVYWGLHHPTVGAVLGSFALGYSVDVVSSPILGLNACAMSVVFLAVYLSSRSIWPHSYVASTLVVLIAALVKGVVLVAAWALFLSTERFWVGAIKYIITEALIAAVVAPFVFALLERGQKYLETTRRTAQ